MATGRALDPQTARVLADLEGPGVPQVADMSPEDARRHIEAFVRKWDLKPAPRIGAVEDLTMPGPDADQTIRARLYRPSAAEGALPLMVFFHAGGYVFGSIGTHESFCRLISDGAGCLVLSVDYRRAPEHKFPAAHEDCYAATAWAAGNADAIGADPAKLAVGAIPRAGRLRSAFVSSPTGAAARRSPTSFSGIREPRAGRKPSRCGPFRKAIS